jgi:N4-gp56 family major capsid protein
MGITTLTQLPPEVRVYFDRLLLALARPYFIYDLFAQKRQIPLNSGDQMVFRRYGTLTSAVVPLTDGQTPPGDQLAVTDFKAAISWYGSFVTIKGCGDFNKPNLIDLDLLAALLDADGR